MLRTSRFFILGMTMVIVMILTSCGDATNQSSFNQGIMTSSLEQNEPSSSETKDKGMTSNNSETDMDTRKKTIEAFYNNIKIFIDGNQVNPKDANGNTVEPFIYNGTTYLPVRAVGEAFGKSVSWDGSTQSVFLGDMPGQNTNWMYECTPYEIKSGSKYLSSDGKSFVMSGNKHTDGFTLSTDSGYALFNLNGEYSEVIFDVGHIDGGTDFNAELYIYVDDKLVKEDLIKADAVAKRITVPLNRALQMKIQIKRENGGLNSCSYGFANGKLSK